MGIEMIQERWTFEQSRKEGRYGAEHDLRINGPAGERIATLYPAVVVTYEADGTPYPLHMCPIDPKVIERGKLAALAPKLLEALRLCAPNAFCLFPNHAEDQPCDGCRGYALAREIFRELGESTPC